MTIHLIERLVELRARRQPSQFFGMPRAFQVDLKPLSRWSRMLASFAPIILLRDNNIIIVADFAIGNPSSFSDMARLFQVYQKRSVAGE